MLHFVFKMSILEPKKLRSDQWASVATSPMVSAATEPRENSRKVCNWYQNRSKIAPELVSKSIQNRFEFPRPQNHVKTQEKCAASAPAATSAIASAATEPCGNSRKSAARAPAAAFAIASPATARISQNQPASTRII